MTLGQFEALEIGDKVRYTGAHPGPNNFGVLTEIDQTSQNPYKFRWYDSPERTTWLGDGRYVDVSGENQDSILNTISVDQ